VGVLFLTSCAKESTVTDKKNVENFEMDGATKKRVDDIKDFTDRMAGQTAFRSNGKVDYTSDEFLTNTQDAINYDYSEPFVRYWDVETKIDSFSIPLTDCKLSEADATLWYTTVFDKVRCHFTCSNLQDKELKLVTLQNKNSDCNHIMVEMRTLIGSLVVTSDINLEMETGGVDPTGSHAGPTRKTFKSSLWGSWGSCSIPHPPLQKHTATILSEYCDYNVVGGSTPGYSLVNAEFMYLTSYLTPGTGWWYMWCYDPTHEEDNCGATISCQPYFQPHPLFPPQSGVLDYNTFTPTGADLYCLSKNELNSILSTTEGYCKSVATAAGKQYVDLWAELQIGACFDFNHHWYGWLTIGKKVPRIRKMQVSPIAENCQCD